MAPLLNQMKLSLIKITPVVVMYKSIYKKVNQINLMNCPLVIRYQ